jgi:trehalose 6-phosphate phosphatase
VEGVSYAGAYGLERVIDGAVVVDPRVDPWLDAIAEAAEAAEVDLPGLLVERKGLVAVTIHWRTQPERGAEAEAWAAAATARLGLEAPLRGRMAVELRPPVPVDKGTTVVDLSRHAQTAAFAGDDAGDVPAFDALHALAQAGALEHAVSIGVASDEGPPEVRAADLVVEGPRGLAELLDGLADELSARG